MSQKSAGHLSEDLEGHWHWHWILNKLGYYCIQHTIYNMKKLLLFFAFFLFIGITKGQNEGDTIDMESLNALFSQDSILRSFHYRTGRVIIGDKLASIDVPPGCVYLGPEESKYMMEQIFGNPPSPLSLGMLLADTPSVISGVRWVIDYNYNADGHVNDDDAKDIKYDDLLKQLKEETEEINKDRIAQGFEGVKMIGWAQSPFYDEKNKKLHWAKELKFGNAQENTLNYNIRVLGREGYLEMNIITGMSGLPDVKQDINTILNSTNFLEGQRYADYNEDTDKTAEYGIGGLIVGGVLAKTGILAKIGVFLLKIIKPLIVGVIALFGFIGKRLFGKKKEEEVTEEPSNDTPAE